MIVNIPRAWPCEYCGEPHGPGVLCEPRMGLVASLVLGLEKMLVCQYVVEPQELKIAETYTYTVSYVVTNDEQKQPIMYGIAVGVDEGPQEGTYLALDRSQFSAFTPYPPKEALGVLRREDMQKWAEEAWPAPEPTVVVVPQRKLYARVRISAEEMAESARDPQAGWKRFIESDLFGLKAIIEDLKRPRSPPPEFKQDYTFDEDFEYTDDRGRKVADPP